MKQYKQAIFRERQTDSVAAVYLEPLADYLEPQFGNVYSYNLPDAGSLRVQEWTAELRQAVKHYLVNEASNNLYAAFLVELDFDVPAGPRTDQATFIIERAEAWEIAHVFHLAAVKAVSTLDQLIGKHGTWSDPKLQEDVGHWLDAHASEVQLLLLAKLTNHPERNADTPWYSPAPTGWDFTRGLAPPVLLDAWRDLVGTAESDLTDDEWQLLLPLATDRPRGRGSRLRTEYDLWNLRRVFDGIRFKFARGVPWSHLPCRYGRWENVYQRYVNYRDRGDFARMHQALRRQRAAEEIALWLEKVATKHAVDSVK